MSATLLTVALLFATPLRADDPGYALRFDGVSDMVRLSETVYMMGGAGSGWETTKTVSLWLKPTGSSFCSAPAATHCDAVFGDRPRWWGISRGTVGGLDRLWVWNYDGQSQAIGVEYEPDEWLHIALVHGGGTLSAYKNGTLVGSMPSGATLQPNTGAAPTLYIGGIINNANRNWTFEGEIDEVRIFNVARSEQEIRDDMNRHLTGLEPGLAAYYQMSDGAGAELTDDSGYGWKGTLLDGGNGVPADGPIEWVASGAFGVAPNAVPVAEPQQVTTPEDTDAAITLVGTDDDGDPLTFTVVAPPASGTLVGVAPDLTYVPAADFNGTDSFTFVVEDEFETSTEATVDIEVTPVNDVPVALDTLVAVEENSPGVGIDLAALVGDVETAPADLTYTIVTPPASGTLSGSGASLSYTPAPDFTGLDSFTYQVTDRGDPDDCAPGPGCAAAESSPVQTVTLDVTRPNTPPVAHGQSVTTAEDTATGITLSGSDADGDPLTFEVVTLPGQGTLTGTAPDLIYTPGQDFHGDDTFSFRVDDGEDLSAPQTVVVTVTPVNDAPVATDDAALTAPDTDVTVTVLDNDTDVDGDLLTITSVQGASNGLVTHNGNSVNYAPDPGFLGTDTFTYTIEDPSAAAASATVTVDVGVVGDPVEIGAYGTPGDAHDLALVDSLVFVADRSGGLQIIDIANPSAPVGVGSRSFSGGAQGVAVANGHAYVANGNNGLRVVDVTNPAAPVEVGSIDTSGYATDVDVDGNLAYVADRWGGLVIVDVSDPTAPAQLSTVATSAQTLGVAISGGYVVAADHAAGVTVLDVSNPASPVVVSSFQTMGPAHGIDALGSLVYVAAGQSGMQIVDITNPAAPYEAGRHDTPGWARGVTVQGSYAFVADWNAGLRIVDVGTPSSPAEVASYQGPGRTKDILLTGPYILLANYEGGLRILTN